MWNRLGQWDTHRDVIKGQQDGLSDSGVGYGQTESQDGRVDGQVIAPSSDNTDTIHRCQHSSTRGLILGI